MWRVIHSKDITRTLRLYRYNITPSHNHRHTLTYKTYSFPSQYSTPMLMYLIRAVEIMR